MMKVNSYSNNQVNVNYLKQARPSFGFKVRYGGTDDVALAFDRAMPAEFKKHLEKVNLINKLRKEIDSYEFRGVKAPQELLAAFERLKKDV
ncbi:hypothetical protein IJE86_06075 [bacterium]|nr:hypothetical protein [bacterium]